MLGKPSPDVTARTWLALEQQELLCAQLLLLRTQLLLLLAQRSDLLVVVLSARLLDLHLNLLQLRAHRLDLSHHFVYPGLVAHDEGCQEKDNAHTRVRRLRTVAHKPQTPLQCDQTVQRRTRAASAPRVWSARSCRDDVTKELG